MRWTLGLVLLMATPAGFAQQTQQGQQGEQAQETQQQERELLNPMEMRELARSTTQMRDILRDLSYLMDREEMARGGAATEIAELLSTLGDTLQQMSRRIVQGSADAGEREDINQTLTAARQQLQAIERHRVGP